MKSLALLLFLLFPSVSFGGTGSNPGNWSGSYAPCHRHTDLLSKHYVNLGVRFSTSNAMLAEQFGKAMDFWSRVLDMEWHEEDSEECAIQVLDGTPSLFDFCMCLSARAQLPDQPAFQGWVAFNPRMKLKKEEMFLDSVHEIGHLLGLAHNPSETSVMFYLGLEKVVSLNAADLDNLAARHRLRRDLSDVRVVAPRKGLRWARFRVTSFKEDSAKN